MPLLLPRRRRLALLLCLLGASALPLTAAEARHFGPDSSDGIYRSTGVHSATGSGGDRHRDWLDAQRAQAERSFQQTQRRLDLLEHCLERSRYSQERDLCLRRDLETRARQWQRDQRDWQQLIRRQGRIAQLAWPLGD